MAWKTTIQTMSNEIQPQRRMPHKNLIDWRWGNTVQCDAEYRTFIYYSSTQIFSLTALPVLTDNEISNGRYVYEKKKS